MSKKLSGFYYMMVAFTFANFINLVYGTNSAFAYTCAAITSWKYSSGTFNSANSSELRECSYYYGNSNMQGRCSIPSPGSNSSGQVVCNCSSIASTIAASAASTAAGNCGYTYYCAGTVDSRICNSGTVSPGYLSGNCTCCPAAPTGGTTGSPANANASSQCYAFGNFNNSTGTYTLPNCNYTP